VQDPQSPTTAMAASIPFAQAMNFSLFFVSITLTFASVSWNMIVWTSGYMLFNRLSIDSAIGIAARFGLTNNPIFFHDRF
jgi:hypothetical protein